MDTQTTPAGSTNKTAMIIAVVAIVAIAIWLLAKPNMSALAPEEDLQTDETSMVQTEATQGFSSSDDTSALEADLTASMTEFN